MEKVYSLQEILENRLNGRSTVNRPVIKAKPICAATPEELDRVVRAAAKRVIEQRNLNPVLDLES